MQNSCILSCQKRDLSHDRSEKDSCICAATWNICSKYIVSHVASLFNWLSHFIFHFAVLKSNWKIYFSCQNCAFLHVMWKMVFAFSIFFLYLVNLKKTFINFLFECNPCENFPTSSYSIRGRFCLVMLKSHLLISILFSLDNKMNVFNISYLQSPQTDVKF